MYPNFSEFGLYRYESASSRFRNKRNGLYSTAIFYSIIVMAIIFSIILYIFISNRQIEITNNFVNNTRKYLPRNSTINSGLEIIEIAAKNSSEISLHSKRIKRLDSEDESNDSPEHQKLVRYQNRRPFLQPRIAPRNQFTSLPPNHKLSPRRMESRANYYRQSTLMPKPKEYLKPPTGKSYYSQVNNIQDILRSNHRNHYQPITAAPHFAHPNHNNQAQMSQFAQFSHNQMQSVPVQLTGKYRHPRTNVDLPQIFKQNQGLQAEGSDPFRNFKPASPFDINQMINQNTDHQQNYINGMSTDSPRYFRRRQKVAKLKENLYGNGIKVEDRNEVSQSKPFSVMLDVFPMQGEEAEFQQQLQQQQQNQQLLQMQKLSRFRPLMSRYYQDPQFFNTMNFPQLMPRYPTPYFRYQHQPQASSNHGKIESNGIEKPSQLIVHLNLYPKQNSAAAFKRSSTEDEEEMRLKKQQQEEIRNAKKAVMRRNQTLDISSTPFNINFNVLAGNAHPENVMYQKIREFNRTSSTSTEATQSQNYFYDEEEDFDTNQSGFSVAPSLVYKNIFRDRPMHMMLRNNTAVATTTTKQPNMIKTNQKFEYQAIKRPKTKYFNYIPKIPPFYRR